MVFQTEKMMKDMEDKLEADDKAKVEASLTKLKEHQICIVRGWKRSKTEKKLNM